MNTKRRGHSGWSILGMAVAAATLSASPAAAQYRGHGFERASRAAHPHVGIAAVVAQPRGEMGLLVDAGGGLQLDASWPLDAAGHVRLRADGGFLVYGHERQRVCFGGNVGCRIDLDLTTTNAVLFAGLGPELVLASGAVRPYVNASAGLAYFATTSALSGSHDHDDFAGTTNFSDAGFAWRGGGGLRVRISEGRRPVALDLGAEYHRNGVMDYLTEGDIQDNPDGSITVFPTRSEADMLAFRFGVSIGLPRGGNDDHDRDRRRDGRRRR